MLIYTAMPSKARLEHIERLGMGVMISSTAGATPLGDIKKIPCALDNGAFNCYRRGYPFMEDVFIETIKKSYLKGISLDFIACPDIIGKGVESLMFSVKWATGDILSTAPNLALVVQDGLVPKDVKPYIKLFSHVFIGGSVGWKWGTAQEWCNFAHDNQKKLHIGQVGQLHLLERSRDIGADSVDSTNWSRHEKWEDISQFIKPNDLFTNCAKHLI